MCFVEYVCKTHVNMPQRRSRRCCGAVRGLTTPGVNAREGCGRQNLLTSQHDHSALQVTVKQHVPPSLECTNS